jgi:thiol-disulfide isomerase/thioredoxin
MSASSSDFRVIGRVLYFPNTVGLSHILVGSSSCKFCDEMLPLFQQISKQIPGIYKTINIDHDAEFVNMCARTDYPIEYVPTLMSFRDGELIGIYGGDPLNRNTLLEYIQSCNQSQQTPQGKQAQPTENDNLPVKGSRRRIGRNQCHASINEAYGNDYVYNPRMK